MPLIGGSKSVFFPPNLPVQAIGTVVWLMCAQISQQETLNARSEYTNSVDDGTAEHRINQYLIKQEIGRGSFGAVHLAVDQFGQEYVGV